MFVRVMSPERDVVSLCVLHVFACTYVKNHRCYMYRNICIQVGAWSALSTNVYSVFFIDKHMNVNMIIYAYIHRYIHAYIHTYIHTYIIGSGAEPARKAPGSI